MSTSKTKKINLNSGVDLVGSKNSGVEWNQWSWKKPITLQFHCKDSVPSIHIRINSGVVELF